MTEDLSDEYIQTLKKAISQKYASFTCEHRGIKCRIEFGYPDRTNRLEAIVCDGDTGERITTITPPNNFRALKVVLEVVLERHLLKSVLES